MDFSPYLESYADYSNRISRGRSYVKKNLVLDLTITKGTVTALVQGSRAASYEVIVKIDSLNNKNWEKVREECNNSIESMEELVEGKFPKELERLFTERRFGLFPSPEEIHFGCSCPDWANMCKHVAAVLYGIGARLDHDPMNPCSSLIFVISIARNWSRDQWKPGWKTC